MSAPCVLVVHCVDAEGPIGGDVRRRPDGSREFYDNWDDILLSLSELTDEKYRTVNCDSFGNPFKLAWFCMDFTGFKTNPKERIQRYNDVYDNLKQLNTSADTFEWHYHQPPVSGVGDEWSGDWKSSDEHYNILGHRILHRCDFPEAYRAGGTIEDNACSRWLEDNVMFDYSNRVSCRSFPSARIEDFNWHGAPIHWGYYHPSTDDPKMIGNTMRYVVRCVDLRSRLHELEQWEVDEAFSAAVFYGRPVILSYFSHDHRDMRAETHHAMSLLRSASSRFSVGYAWASPKQAVQVAAGIVPKKVAVSFEMASRQKCIVRFSGAIYQKRPFLYGLTDDNSVVYLGDRAKFMNELSCSYAVEFDSGIVRLGVGCTSMTGDNAAAVFDVEKR